MKQLSIFGSILVFFVLASCSSNEEPDYDFFMQPSSIQSADTDAINQMFGYDDYGRIVSWECISNNPKAPNNCSARYSYPDENTIKVSAEEFLPNQHRIYEESIELENGRASKSEGTYINIISTDAGTTYVKKTYRLAFDYLPTNHLNTVEHFEVLGIGDDIKGDAWDKTMKWENYLIWENGNLKELQNYQGSSKHYQSTKYEYLADKVSYPIIMPMVIQSAHHQPLCMQGVFGSNSVNLVKSAQTFDSYDNLTFSRLYSYEFDQARISKYTETINSPSHDPITYTVIWTEK